MRVRHGLVFALCGVLLALALTACGSDDNGTPQSGCIPGYPTCACADKGACLSGLSCQGNVCTLPGDGDQEADLDLCTAGYGGCACAAQSACLTGFQCENATCVAAAADGDSDTPVCIPGYEGCSCALGTACLDGLACQYGLCVHACPPGQMDCPCAGTTCQEGLACVYGVCIDAQIDGDKEPEPEATACTCSDYRGLYCLIAPVANRKIPLPRFQVTIDAVSADPLDCRQRGSLLSLGAIVDSFTFDRCDPKFPLTLEGGKGRLDYSETTHTFTLTIKASTKEPSGDTVYRFSPEACANHHCYNASKDFDETDQDCGGTQCLRCAKDQACGQTSDCQSGLLCRNAVCTLPSCGDGSRNSELESCDDGNTEAQDGCDSDCHVESGYQCQDNPTGLSICTCQADLCPTSATPCLAPACGSHGCTFEPYAADYVLPAELQTSGDCKSVVCDGQGQSWTINDANDLPPAADCRSTSCDNGTPVIQTSPADTGCAMGLRVCSAAGLCVECNRNAQCHSPNPYCINHVCSGPACQDNQKNGQETDTDCGGMDCTLRCALGKGCAMDSDCSSAICAPDQTCKECRSDLNCPQISTHCASSGSCVAVPAHCQDQMKNNNETDVDCGGGGDCRRCTKNHACVMSSDCLSGTCMMGLCS